MSDRFHVSTRKGLFTVTRNGHGWAVDKIDFLGEPVTQHMLDPRDGTLYAVLTLGHFGCKLRRSADGGKTWEECGVPVYPEGATYPDRGSQPKPANLTEIWALEPGGPDEPGVLWAGTIPGGLFRSADRGATWQLVEGLWNREERMKWFGGGKDLPGIHSVCVDPRDARKVYVGISCGGVWMTADGGATWAPRAKGMRAEYVPPDLAYDVNIQDPHRLTQCPAQPDTLWVQHHNGIFRSTDGGKEWSEIKDVKPSVFGFAVVVHPQNGDRAWFVPAKKDECRIPVGGKLVVNRTSDGGKTFDTITAGLPQDHCYDLVYRHALDIDRSGDRLAFGSTTGGVWTSDDGGDSWRCLSTTLPPVYTVRFA
jgi:photosystem II stability/assembly factor-like uncharacterized protein